MNGCTCRREHMGRLKVKEKERESEMRLHRTATANFERVCFWENEGRRVMSIACLAGTIYETVFIFNIIKETSQPYILNTLFGTQGSELRVIF